MSSALVIVSVLFGLASLVYLTLALWKVMTYRVVPPPSAERYPPVSILKPLCGVEPGLHEMLHSFCRQDYPEFEIIFGVRSAADPAVAVVRRLQAEHPLLRLHLVVDDTLHGPNRKVSNLINMEAAAQHDILVISDSDVRVGPRCLAEVIDRLVASDAAAVSCLYKGWPRPGLPSRLGALFVNDWFLSSAIVEAGLRSVKYCFGPVTAVRRSALQSIGGLRAFTHDLADDYQLGHRLARAGHSVALSSHTVDTLVDESAWSLFGHELRWARTVRALRPVDHFLSVFTCINPIVALLVVIAPSLAGAIVLGGALGLRALLHLAIRRRVEINEPTSLALLPVREALCLAIWIASYCGRSINWRGQRFVVGPDARLMEDVRAPVFGRVAPVPVRQGST